MTSLDEFTTEQIRDALVAALKARDMPLAASLLSALAVRDPALAAALAFLVAVPPPDGHPIPDGAA